MYGQRVLEDCVSLYAQNILFGPFDVFVEFGRRIANLETNLRALMEHLGVRYDYTRSLNGSS